MKINKGDSKCSIPDIVAPNAATQNMMQMYFVQLAVGLPKFLMFKTKSSPQ